MMTTETAQQHLDAWIAADLALANAKSYQLVTPSGSRTVTRADVKEVQSQIKFWQQMVSSCAGQLKKSPRVAYASFGCA